MQTFSNMRRNSTNQKSIIPIKWVLFLILYQMATSLYPYLTPLIGFTFCYLLFLSEDEEKTREEDTLKKYLAYGYLVFANLNKGFFLFSGLLTFFLFYHLLSEWISTSFKCKNCIIFAFVASGYLGIFGINNLLAYMLNQEFFTFGWEYGLYIICDFFIALIFFRDRLS